MRNLIPSLALMGCVAGVPAFADEPAAPAAAASPPAAAATTATAPATAPAATSTTVAAADAQAAARIRRIRTQGYKPSGEHDGQTVWCRSETPIGSHLESKVCHTADQIDAIAQAGQDTVRDYQQKANVGPQSH